MRARITCRDRGQDSCRPSQDKPRGRGGIGRRRGLKILRRKACGFEPHRPYQCLLVMKLSTRTMTFERRLQKWAPRACDIDTAHIVTAHAHIRRRCRLSLPMLRARRPDPAMPAPISGDCTGSSPRPGDSTGPPPRPVDAGAQNRRFRRLRAQTRKCCRSRPPRPGDTSTPFAHTWRCCRPHPELAFANRGLSPEVGAHI